MGNAFIDTFQLGSWPFSRIILLATARFRRGRVASSSTVFTCCGWYYIPWLWHGGSELVLLNGPLLFYKKRLLVICHGQPPLSSIVCCYVVLANSKFVWIYDDTQEECLSPFPKRNKTQYCIHLCGCSDYLHTQLLLSLTSRMSSFLHSKKQQQPRFILRTSIRDWSLSTTFSQGQSKLSTALVEND